MGFVEYLPEMYVAESKCEQKLQAGRNSNSEKIEVLADFQYISSADWAEQPSQKRLVLYSPLQKALWVEIVYSFLMNLKIHIKWHELICSEHLAARKK
jgi:hypothetical protein